MNTPYLGGSKYCLTCKTLKAKTDFQYRKERHSYRNECKACRNNYNKQFKPVLNKEKILCIYCKKEIQANNLQKHNNSKTHIKRSPETEDEKYPETEDEKYPENEDEKYPENEDEKYPENEKIFF